MHTDLSPHLHNNVCNELILLLQKCHQDNPFGKFFGVCNTEDADMRKCLRTERLERRKRNYEKSMELKEKLRKMVVDTEDL